jgi:hypothetical protein
MNNKILDYSFLGVLSLFLICASIMVISKSSDSLQVGVGILIILVVLGVGIGTYFLGNKVNMMSIAGVTVVLFLIILIYSILKSNDDSNENLESFTTTPIGYKNLQGAFIPTYSSNMDNLNSDGTSDETKEKISELQNEIQNAEESCSSLTSLQNEMLKYQSDDTSGGLNQGPCIDENGNMGYKLLSTGNICIPLDVLYSKNMMRSSGKDGESEEEGDLNYNDGNDTSGNMTACYSKDSDFNSICKQSFGNNYTKDSLVECTGINEGKYRAKCVLQTISVLEDDELETPCYNYYTILDNVCKSVARENGKNNFQKYGVKKYIKCTDEKNKKRAICKPYYENGLPTHETNLTSCINADSNNLNLKFNAICNYKGKKINTDLVPYNIKPYDCEFGKLRAECISRDMYNKLREKRSFYNEILI